MREDKVITRMIEIYCNQTHGTHKREICTQCSTLLEYSLQRLYNCPLQPNKPVCSSCLIHCYRDDMRIEIKKVMRFSRKRILLNNPILSLRYLLKKWTMTD